MARSHINRYWCPECCDVRHMYVIEHRLKLSKVGSITRRRLQCKECRTRFTSHETIRISMQIPIEEDLPLTSSDVDTIREIIMSAGHGSVAMYAAMAALKLGRPVSATRCQQAINLIGMELMRAYRDAGHRVGVSMARSVDA